MALVAKRGADYAESRPGMPTFSLPAYHSGMIARFAALALLGLAASAAAACNGGDRPNVASPVVTPAQAPSPSATPLPSNTAVPARVEVSSTVVLVDAGTATGKTLYESKVTAVGDVAFAGDRVLVQAGRDTLQFGLDGVRISTPPPPVCGEANGAAEFAGRAYPGVACGVLSPDHRWMIYHVDAGEVTLPSGYRVPRWDQWVVDLRTGATRLVQAGLVHCGGCDARYGPRWSPNGRYVAYAEIGGNQRRFLTDMVRGTTRQIGTGSEVTLAPVFSPTGDALLFGSRSGGRSVLEDLAAGTARELDLPWPAAFDRSGTLVYSPAWSQGTKETGQSTTIIEAASGSVVAKLAGAPSPWRLYTNSFPVAATPNGLLVALQQAPGCAGTAIYLQGQLRQCVIDGAEASIGPGGIVAVARKAGSVGPATGSQFATISIDRFEVDLVSPSGQVQTVVRGALSLQAPLMIWNALGSHLLVVWPRSPGL